MTSDSRKAAFERSIFLEFAAAAGLPVVPGSVRSRPTPEPDVLCEVADRGPVAFELVAPRAPPVAAGPAARRRTSPTRT
jgi:hypothetical protein